MAKTKEQKEKIVDELAEKLSRMKSVVFSCYEGLSVKELSDLRSILKKANCEYLVAKKTLLKMALEKEGIKGIDLDKLSGGLGLAFAWQDEIEAARLLHQFAKEHQALKISGAILEGEFIEAEKAKAMARLPSKEELLAKVVWLVKTPVTDLVNVLQGNLRGLVCLLEGIRKQKDIQAS